MEKLGRVDLTISHQFTGSELERLGDVMGILLTIVRPSPTRFAGGELEWLEKRLRQVELPAVAASALGTGLENDGRRPPRAGGRPERGELALLPAVAQVTAALATDEPAALGRAHADPAVYVLACLQCPDKRCPM
ncbi:hypothetical protein FJT64_018498 [Amphibalanus amphitrite]|uniref:Uncharacterized protein n=1 Tax=Amphibalanus amphitrite TaxID=1232801 RepID=A0A6A4WSM9_AMPAM|nr:hypothetical protein FJT64_018498 [Amphibalanus amphitrite]